MYLMKTLFKSENPLRAQCYSFGNTVLGSATGLESSEGLGIEGELNEDVARRPVPSGEERNG